MKLQHLFHRSIKGMLHRKGTSGTSYEGCTIGRCMSEVSDSAIPTQYGRMK